MPALTRLALKSQLLSGAWHTRYGPAAPRSSSILPTDSPKGTVHQPFPIPPAPTFPILLPSPSTPARSRSSLKFPNSPVLFSTGFSTPPGEIHSPPHTNDRSIRLQKPENANKTKFYNPETAHQLLVGHLSLGPEGNTPRPVENSASRFGPPHSLSSFRPLFPHGQSPKRKSPCHGHSSFSPRTHSPNKYQQTEPNLSCNLIARQKQCPRPDIEPHRR